GAPSPLRCAGRPGVRGRTDVPAQRRCDGAPRPRAGHAWPESLGRGGVEGRNGTIVRYPRLAPIGVRRGATMSYANLAEMFFTRARELAARPRYRYRVADGWREVTWQTMAERVRAIAAGLLDLGVAPGD